MKIFRDITKPVLVLCAVLLSIVVQAQTVRNQTALILSCKEDNDLYQALKKNNISCIRYNTPGEAINNAHETTGVLILADGYPAKTTEISDGLYTKAAGKKRRLFVEYPSYVPGLTIEASQSTSLERVVVATGDINNMAKMQILALHGCNYLPVW